MTVTAASVVTPAPATAPKTKSKPAPKPKAKGSTAKAGKSKTTSSKAPKTKPKAPRISHWADQWTRDFQDDLVNKCFSLNVYERRLELGLTQDELATNMGCVRTNIVNIEAGRSAASIRMLAWLCVHLDTNPSHLMRRRPAADLAK